MNLLQAIEHITGYNEIELFKKNKFKSLVEARHIYFHIAHEVEGIPKKELSEKYNFQVNHISGMIEKAIFQLKYYPEYKNKYNKILELMDKESDSMVGMDCTIPNIINMVSDTFEVPIIDLLDYSNNKQWAKNGIPRVYMTKLIMLRTFYSIPEIALILGVGVNTIYNHLSYFDRLTHEDKNKQNQILRQIRGLGNES